MSQSASPLLAHTGHEHNRGSQSSQPDPAPAEPSTSASGSSSHSAMDGATSDPTDEAMPPGPESEHQTTAPEQDSTGVDPPQQPVPTTAPPDAAIQAPSELDQAALVGNLGGEFLLLLIVAAPVVLRQLRRWI